MSGNNGRFPTVHKSWAFRHLRRLSPVAPLVNLRRDDESDEP
ncbi:MAG: hypothetical protein AAF614_15505 [Chloroflexota bacterium]